MHTALVCTRSDAHCKPHEDWLEPIAKSLRQNWKRVLNMEVGLLDGDKWREMPGGAIGAKAAFYWSLTHFWEVRGDSPNELRVVCFRVLLFARLWLNSLLAHHPPTATVSRIP